MASCMVREVKTRAVLEQLCASCRISVRKSNFHKCQGSLFQHKVGFKVQKVSWNWDVVAKPDKGISSQRLGMLCWKGNIPILLNKPSVYCICNKINEVVEGLEQSDIEWQERQVSANYCRNFWTLKHCMGNNTNRLYLQVVEECYSQKEYCKMLSGSPLSADPQHQLCLKLWKQSS